MEKTIQLFDRKSVPVSDFTVLGILKKTTATCPSPDGSVWVGTSDGRLVRLDLTLSLVGQPVQAFPETQPVLSLTTSNQCLVALGRIGPDHTARVCAYHLYRSEEKNQPVFIGSVRVPGELIGTCLAVTQDFANIAVGCEKGQTLIYSGSTFGKQGVKPRILSPESGTKPIVSVYFSNKSSLFIVTECDVTCVRVTTDSVSVEHVDTSLGTLVSSRELVFCVGPEFSNTILIAKPDAVYGFTFGEGNTSALQLVANAEDVHAITGWKQYIVLFHDQTVSIVAAFPQSSNKVLAGTFSVPKNTEVLGIVPGAFDGHSVLVLTSSGEDGPIVILNLREKSVHDQIALLEKNELFEAAMDLAAYTKQPKEILAEIIRSYGDNLFNQNELDKAVSVYSRSLDLDLPLESSYVINKFLSSDRKIVIEYLKKLKSSSVQHIGLLILCLESIGQTNEIKDLLSTLGETDLLLLLESNMSLIRFITNQDIERINDKKRILELLLTNQKIDKFNQAVIALSEIHQLVEQSPNIKKAIVHGSISGDITKSKSYDLSLQGHIDYCKSFQIPSLSPEGGVFDDKYLLLLLELTLRVKKGNCKDLVKRIIESYPHIAEEAMIVCKMFGAPSSIILPLAAALNKPYDALAYPAMPMEDVVLTIPSSQSLTLTALAAMKRSGSRSDTEFTVSSSDKDGAAIVIETVDENSQFGQIKGVLLREFNIIEENEYEQNQRAESDQIEIQRMKNEIIILKRKPIIHSIGDNACSLCNCPLATDMPILVFKCTHSFHQHCAAEDIICRLCANESKQHKEILLQRKKSIHNHDELFKRMAGEKDKFQAAMAYLGHGLFSR